VVVYSARDEAHARHSGEIQWLQRLQSALKENRFHLYQQIIVPANGPNGRGPAMEVFCACAMRRAMTCRPSISCAPRNATA